MFALLEHSRLAQLPVWQLCAGERERWCSLVVNCEWNAVPVCQKIDATCPQGPSRISELGLAADKYSDSLPDNFSPSSVEESPLYFLTSLKDEAGCLLHKLC